MIFAKNRCMLQNVVISKFHAARDFSKWDTHQRFDPIPPVGDAVLEQMNVLCLDEFQAGVIYY